MTKRSDQNPTANPEIETEIRVGWKMAGIGMQVASEVAAGTLLGVLFDWWRGTGRVGVIVGAITGIAVGLWILIQQALKLNRQLDVAAPTKGRGKPIPPDEDQEEDRWGRGSRGD